MQPTKHEHELLQYYQLSILICEANSLKPFVEEACDGVGVTLVTGNGELFRQALSNQEDVERKEKQLEKLESSWVFLYVMTREQRLWKMEKDS